MMPSTKTAKPQLRGVTIWFVISVLTLSAGLISCGENDPDVITPKPDTTMEQGTTGMSLYRFHCASCHGLDGRPLVKATSDLRDYKGSLDSFNVTMNAGPGLMPRYEHFDSEQRLLVYQHIQTFER